jgi:hypothetical protein
MNRDEGNVEAQEQRGAAKLAEALDSLRPSFDVDEAVALATKRPARSGYRWGHRVLRGFVPRRRVLRWAVPALATVPVIGAFWVATRTAPAALPAVVHVASLQSPATLPAGEPESAPFSINAPEGGQVAVFQTSNPKIRVVWFYDEEESDN